MDRYDRPLIHINLIQSDRPIVVNHDHKSINRRRQRATGVDIRTLGAMYRG